MMEPNINIEMKTTKKISTTKSHIQFDPFLGFRGNV